MPLIYGDLLTQEVTTDAIHIYRCQVGLENMSPSGEGYGVKARIQRFVQSLGYEGKHLLDIKDELLARHASVGVAADDDDTKRAVATILGKHGGHDIKFYARFTIEDL